MASSSSSQNKKIRAVYIGTPDFSADIFTYLIRSEKLLSAGFEFVGVISNPDRPAQRDQKITPTPVKLAGLNSGVPVIQLESAKESSSLEAVKQLNPDIMIMCAFSQILPDEFLKIPKLGVVNIHYSLLPRWRGAAPVQYSLLNGDKTTGVALIMADRLMDHGPIVAKEELAIDESDDAETLIEKLTEVAKALAENTLPLIISGSIKPEAQNENEEVLYCRKIQKQDGLIIWDRRSEEIVNRIRAFKIWPGSYTYLKKESSGQNAETKTSPTQIQSSSEEKGSMRYTMIKIIKARSGQSPEAVKDLMPGKVFLNKQGQLSVKTGDGSVIIDILQMEGKKESDAPSFINGNSWIIGKTFVS